MRRPWLLPTIAAGAAVIIIAAMAMLSAMLLGMERQRLEARAAGDLEQRVSLALWRMEGVASLIVSEQAARPVMHFTAPLEAQFADSVEDRQPLALAHYEVVAEAEPTLDKRADASLIDWLNDRLTAPPADAPAPPAAGAGADPPSAPSDNAYASKVKGGDYQQRATNQVRQAAVENWNLNELQVQPYTGQAEQQQAPADDAGAAAQAEQIRHVSIMLPRVVDDRLLLVRRVDSVLGQRAQVVDLDTVAVKAQLHAAIADLLPDASLHVFADGEAVPPQRKLAALPLRLDPGVTAATLAAAQRSQLGGPLVIGWAVVLAALAVVMAGVIALVRLSQRRAMFVSAVTHEMRTPVTTLQMYTEMLADGMITDETQRQSYLHTLRGQAVRLGHLIENVLAFARLEKRRAVDQPVVRTVGELLDDVGPRLAERALMDDMTLDVALADAARELRFRAVPAMVEQVLFNLVDNSCKYARDADARRIELHAARTDGHVTLTVHDHGPGVAESDEQLFRAFARSRMREEHASPGVGLGLALGRRMARMMGGDLRLVRNGEAGATFHLTLPAVDR